MPRTIIDIPAEQLAALDRMRARQHVPRSTLIREAVSTYLVSHHVGLAEEAFGIWQNKPVDALAYEQKLRSEWTS